MNRYPRNLIFIESERGLKRTPVFEDRHFHALAASKTYSPPPCKVNRSSRAILDEIGSPNLPLSVSLRGCAATRASV